VASGAVALVIPQTEYERLVERNSTIARKHQRNRQIWQFVADHGCYPVSTTIEVPRPNFHALTHPQKCPMEEKTPGVDPLRDPLHRTFGTPHSIMLAVEGERAPFLDPPVKPAGHLMVATKHSGARVVGAISVPSTLHDTRCIADVAETRMIQNVNPATVDPVTGRGDIYAFDIDSVSGQGVCRFWQKFHREVLRPKPTLEAMQYVTGGMDIGEYTLSKFSLAQCKAAKAQNDMARSAKRGKPGGLPMRALNAKWELVNKENAKIRGICNNGLELMALCYVTCATFSHLMFGPGAPLEKLSIKHQRRDSCLDKTVKTFSRDLGFPVCMVEVDQTSMEMNERSPGNLDFALVALEAIINIIARTFCGQHASRYKTVISYDRENGMRMTCMYMTTVKINGKKKTTFQSKTFYLDSGWLLTSCVNFANETVALLATMTGNPEHILCKNKEGQFMLSRCKQTNCSANDSDSLTSSHNFLFKIHPSLQKIMQEYYSDPTNFKDGVLPPIPKTVYFHPRVEGDDGLAQGSRWFSCSKAVAQIILNMGTIGFESKFKCIVNGRAEYIGAHFLARDGLLSTRYPWIPSIKRYIEKTGVHAQSRADITEQERLVAQTARAYALAAMFYGRIESLYIAFYAMAETSEKELGKYSKDGRLIIENKYDPITYTCNVEVGTHSAKAILAELKRNHSRMTVAFQPGHVQDALIKNSLGLKHGVAVGGFDMWAQDIKVRAEKGLTDHSASWSCIPAEVRAVL